MSRTTLSDTEDQIVHGSHSEEIAFLPLALPLLPRSPKIMPITVNECCESLALLADIPEIEREERLSFFANDKLDDRDELPKPWELEVAQDSIVEDRKPLLDIELPLTPRQYARNFNHLTPVSGSKLLDIARFEASPTSPTSLLRQSFFSPIKADRSVFTECLEMFGAFSCHLTKADGRHDFAYCRTKRVLGRGHSGF